MKNQKENGRSVEDTDKRNHKAGGKRMKKAVMVILAGILVIGSLAACGTDAMM